MTTFTNPLDHIIDINFNRPKIKEQIKPIVKEKSKPQLIKNREQKLARAKISRKEKRERKLALQKELQTILEKLSEDVIMTANGCLTIKNKKYTITYSIRLN